MFKKATLIVVIFTAMILAYAAMQPDTFRIERLININGSPERIFPHIDDFHQWEAWSPWEKTDTEIQRNYRGAESAKDPIYEWQGNKDIGQGRMEIIQSIPSANLVIALHFMQPFEAQNTVEFILQNRDNTTTVTQAMYGPSPLISKLMDLFFNMDKMVGEKYEEGLASLKAIVEK